MNTHRTCFLLLSVGLLSLSPGCGDSVTPALDYGKADHRVDGGAPIADGSPCGPGAKLCGGACTSTDRDPLHCGGCDQPCKAGEVCSAGVCALSCQDGLEKCDGFCVDTDKDLEHCGGCSKPCKAGEVCSSGTCAASCQEGLIVCGGTCIDPKTDRTFCGAKGDCVGTNAGAACSAGTLCAAGSCKTTCLSTQVECGGKCVDPKSDLKYCGAALGGTCSSTSSSSADFKGIACASGQVCAAGSCEASCLGTQVLCAGKCVDPLTDPDHCGAALGGTCSSSETDSPDFQGADCASGQACMAGSCTASCLGTQVLCANKCVDPLTDLDFCGAALGGACSSSDSNSADYQGADCPAGQICGAGTCIPSCLGTQVLCGSKCVDPLTDLAFCGAALGGQCSSTDSGSADYQGLTCLPGQICQAGSCVISCLGTQVLCGGKCVDPQTDLVHCGAVLGGTCNSTDSGSPNFQGVSCPGGQVCAGGTCTTSCLGTQVLCGGKCVDPQTDPDHCGAALGGQCNSASPSSPDYQGGDCLVGEICTAGSCAISCQPGLTNCSGVCTDTDNDPLHCGGCGKSCGTGSPCLGGVCFPACLPESFDSGSIDTPPWVIISAGGGAVTALAAHDGAYGYRGEGDWIYRTDQSLVAGSRAWAWVRGGTGRAYFGFDSSAGGTKSVVAAFNTSELIIQENVGYGYANRATVAHSFTTDRWYRLEVRLLSGTEVSARLYDEDGITLLASVNYTFASLGGGGLAFRSFSGVDIDTIWSCGQ